MHSLSRTSTSLALALSVIVNLAACTHKAPLASAAEATGRFVFASDRSGFLDLYRFDAGTVTALTTDPAYDEWWPRPSPDGRRILYYRSAVADRPAKGNGENNYANAALWSMATDGTGAREVIPKRAHGWTHQGVVNWSPDGRHLVMAAIDPSEGHGRWHLYITDAEGRNPVRISRRVGLYLDPSWSPDGKRIVCAAYPEGVDGLDLTRLEIFSMKADGSDERQLTNDRLRDHDPSWSPDGSEIAFETAVDPGFLGVGKWALRSVHPDGSGLRAIVDDGNINTLPRWSSDGSTLLFHRLEFFSKSKFVIARVRRDGGGLVRLTSGGRYDDVDAAPY